LRVRFVRCTLHTTYSIQVSSTPEFPINMRTLLLPVMTTALFIAAGASAQQPIVIVGATLIDGTGGAPVTDAVVWVEGRTIRGVGARGSVGIPSGAHVIDATGKFIIPGLMDANVHLVSHFNWSRIEFLARYEHRFEEVIEEGAQIALKHGLTTIFDTMGPLAPLLAVRDRINRGETIGSRMFVAGNIVGFRAVFTSTEAMTNATRTFQDRINALWEENMGPDLLVLSPDEVRVETRKYIARGIDFLKYGASGDGFPVSSRIGQRDVHRFTAEQQRAMIEESHRAGITVQTHQSSAEALRVAIESGVDLVQHGVSTGPRPMPDAVLQLMVDRGVASAWDYQGVFEEPESPEDRAARLAQPREQNLARMMAAGIPLLLGTDAGVIDPDVYASMPESRRTNWVNVLGEGHILYLRSVVQRGMSPMDALLTATRNIAAAYQKLDTLGTLEQGKMADLVILDADPLQDIGNVGMVSLVMKEGRVIDRDALPMKRVLTAPRPTPLSESYGSTFD
jgi:imidazolonepropionase-like amidohydrolase